MKYDIKKVKKLFLEFLKEKKITKSFISEVKKGSKIYFIPNIYFNDQYGLVSCHFLWSETEKGSYYWGYIDDEWKEVLNKNDIEYQSILSI